MSAIPKARIAPPDPPRASYLVPAFVAVVVLILSTTLLAIGARSPYTHANLLRGYDPRYDRTQQIRVGDAEPYAGVGEAGGAETTDPAARGARLFVTKGCAACHALEGRGGAVGPSIAGTDLETLREKTRKGPSGMPRYAPETLTEEQLAAIAAYLRSLTGPTPSPGR